MKVKLSLVIQSHLSDIGVMMYDPEMAYDPGIINDHIKLVKNLISKYPDTSVYIEESELNEMWDKIKIESEQ
jgi:hypothetical protein